MRKQLHTLTICCLCFLHSQAQLELEPVANLTEADKVALVPIESEYSNNELSFELFGGLILVEAQTDGATNRYILDTGAPTLILNQKISEHNPNKNYAVGLAGVSATIDVEVDYFRLGTITNPELDAFATDISHLEEIKKTKIDGLVGYEVLKNSNLLLDYQNKTINLLPSGEKHSIEGREEVLAIPFKTRGHMPVIEMYIGNKKLRMGIDTGSEANLLDERFKRKLRKYYAQDFTTRYVRGIDRSTIKTCSVKIDLGQIQHLQLGEMEYLFTDMSFLNSGYGKRMDGILGYPFLKSHLISIDFSKRMIYVLKDKFEKEIEQLVTSEQIIEEH